MSTLAFRLKTLPEIRSNMYQNLIALQGPDVDLNDGSVYRDFIDITSLQDADQYIQIGKLLSNFSRRTAQDEDLDRRALDMGAAFFEQIQRIPAKSSVSYVIVGDGTQIAESKLITAILKNVTTFTVLSGEGTLFSSSGTLLLEIGTARQEEVIYTRVADTFTIIYPTTGTQFSHPINGKVSRISTKSTLASGVSIGATSATLATNTGAAWPTSGDIIFERGTVREELISFTRVADVLTLGSALTFAHNSGSVVTLSTFGSNRDINIDLTAYVQATDTTKQINFRLKQSGILYDGDFASSLILVESENVGIETLAGSNTIVFWSSPPFSGATITNPVAATRGRNKESNSEYRQRLEEFFRSPFGVTKSGIERRIIGVKDEISGQEVAFVQIISPVDATTTPSYLYISDGTAVFALEQTQFIGRHILISDARENDKRGKLSQFGPYLLAASPVDQITPRVFKSVERGSATSVGPDYLEDTSKSLTNDFLIGAYLKTDDNQFFEIIGNTAIRYTLDMGGATPSLGNYSIIEFGSNPIIDSTSTSVAANTLTDSTLIMTVNAHVDHYLKDSAGSVFLITANSTTAFTLDADGATPASGAYTVHAFNPDPLVPNTDYKFNEANGDVELIEALVEHDCLVAASDGGDPSVGAFTYTTGLGAEVTRVLNGDESDINTYPGLKAEGVKILILVPGIISPTLNIQIVPNEGITDDDLTSTVQILTETYVNSLGIGKAIINAEIIKLVKGLSEVYDVRVVDPKENTSIPDGYLARITEENVVVL